MNSIEKSAKTVEEAIERALNELDLPREKVSIEVLEAPSSGLFGFIGAKNAKVKVTPFFGALTNKEIAEKGAAHQQTAEQIAVKLEAKKAEEEKKARKRKEEPVCREVKSVPEEPASYPDDAKLVERDKIAFFIKNTVTLMGIEVYLSKKEYEEYICYELFGPNMGTVIGRRGETLDALQYLVNISCHQTSEDKKRIILDTEGYRKRREETLVHLASRLASKAKKSGHKVSLEPMSPMERRIIHTALQNDNGVTTISEGEEPNRHLVIIPKNESPRKPKRARVQPEPKVYDEDSDDMESLEYMKNYTHVNEAKRNQSRLENE